MARPKKIVKRIKYVGLNFRFYFSFYLGTVGIIGVILSMITSVVNLTDLFTEWKVIYRILLLLGIYLALAIIAIPFFCIKKRIIYYKKGEHEVSAEYGDIDKISSKRGDRKVVVINVNSTFDMIIDNPGENPLVAANTNHGRFILRVCREKKITQEQLNEEVQELLKNKGIKPREIMNRDKGNNNDYPIGTTVIYELGKISYLLFAFSRFDENNRAHPGEESKDDLPLSILMKKINICSQNTDVFIPLMGTGNSRYNLSNQESFSNMKHYFLSHLKQVEGKYRILIYIGARDEVSIFKNL